MMMVPLQIISNNDTQIFMMRLGIDYRVINCIRGNKFRIVRNVYTLGWIERQVGNSTPIK